MVVHFPETEEGPCLKTRASAVKMLQKVSGLIRTGTLSMQWASSPPYSIQLGLVGYACFPLGSSTPNASAPSLLFLCMHQRGFDKSPCDQGHGTFPA